MSERTLQLQRPFGQTLLLALLLLGLLLAAAELFMRQEPVQARLTAPDLSSRHRQFEIQWDRLEKLSRTEDEISCIALGNSMVWLGFDPITVQESYRHQTGADLHCFNFGVDALSPATAGILAEILVETYRPQLLIFGTDARDFAVPRQDNDTAVILDMAWIRYRSGQFNVAGWLVQHSYLYRYRYHLIDIMQFLFQEAIRQRSDTLEQRYGFDSDDTIGEYVIIPPDPNDDSYHVSYYYRVLSDYTIQPENVAGLQQILALKSQGVTVVVVEMPVPDTYFTFFGQAETDYETFLDTVRTATRPHQIPFWESTRLHLIPDDGWVDYSHVNTQGAALFSHWLGQQLGQAANAGQLSSPNSEGSHP